MNRTSITNLKRRDVLKGAGTAGLAIGLAHFLNPALAIGQEPAPKTGGKIVHANCYWLNRAGESNNGRNARYLPTFNTRVFWNCLTWINNEFGVEPELATSWEASDDQKVWEFTLREDVLFHDGTPMTSADVEASFRYHITWAYYAKLMIASVEAVGPYKVRFVLNQGASEFPWAIAEYDHWIGPKKTPEEYMTDTSGIGTGPFRLIDVDNRRSMRGERFENYWVKGTPYIDEYEMVLTTSQASLNGFRSGQFNVSTDFDPALADQYQSADGVVSEVAGYQCALILNKAEGGFFADLRIRKALALAIDRDAINRIVYAAPGAKVGNDSFISTADPHYLAWPGRNLDEAKRLLAEAGHANGITLPTLYYVSWYPEMTRVFSLIAQQVAEAGITMPIEERPADGFGAWSVDPATNPGLFYGSLSGNRHTAATLTRFVRGQIKVDGWEGPAFDKFTELFATVQVTADPAERTRMYNEIQQLLWEDVPHLVPIARRNMLVHKTGIKGMTAHIQHWSHRWETASFA
jgi:peptide/nickel transport system substrate-binding protein